jgi:hypothetical protein
MKVKENKSVSTQTELEAALADPNARIWPEGHTQGRQGDVLIKRIADNDPILDKGQEMARTRVLDRVVARGSRAKHVASPEATVYQVEYQGEPALLVVANEKWALTHTDTSEHRHFPHVILEGNYICRQQVEETAQGTREVID